MPLFRCYNCGELGHLASNCRNQTPAERRDLTRSQETELSTSSRKMLHTHQIQLTLIPCLSFSQLIQTKIIVNRS